MMTIKIDLTNTPPKTKTIKTWLNIYPSGDGYSYTSEEQANTCAGIFRVACIPLEITYTEKE
jgi:hypothetical protein